MRKTLSTSYGSVRLHRESEQLVCISAESDLAAYFAQGYVGGTLRLWQLELSRRVAAGELSAWFGDKTLSTDRFQRSLQLAWLGRREFERDKQSEQARHIDAYVAGVNLAIDELKIRPLEYLLLRKKPERYTALDVYIITQLKFFINSAWQFELFHTLVCGAVDDKRAAELFATHTIEGDVIAPLPRGEDSDMALAIAKTLDAGRDALKVLGLSSPDIGSSAFALKGARTKSGFPLLAADPHMGNVNPGFNLFFKIDTDEGMHVFGSHFPGGPGILVGKNRDIGWGMVGVMADNQDLLVGKIDGDKVRVAGAWEPLEETKTEIALRGRAPELHVARRFSGGHLLHEKDGWGLFFRWPALDLPVGEITVHALNRARDWDSFRASLTNVTSMPMMAVYADRHDNIGMQTIGRIPKRKRPIGSVVLSLDDPDHQWLGYEDFDAMPRAFNPPGDFAVYANQYSIALFSGPVHLSNRWHPPSRARRIQERIAEHEKHDLETLAAIQDDRVDLFARENLSFFLSHLPRPSPLAAWRGDTREVEHALLFERWMAFLVDEVLSDFLPEPLRARYADLWPAHRWNVLAIVRQRSDKAVAHSPRLRTRLERSLAETARRISPHARPPSAVSLALGRLCLRRRKQRNRARRSAQHRLHHPKPNRTYEKSRRLQLRAELQTRIRLLAGCRNSLPCQHAELRAAARRRFVTPPLPKRSTFSRTSPRRQRMTVAADNEACSRLRWPNLSRFSCARWSSMAAPSPSSSDCRGRACAASIASSAETAKSPTK